MSSIPGIDQFLQEAVAQGQLPCVTAIVTDPSRTLYHRAFGKVESSWAVALKIP